MVAPRPLSPWLRLLLAVLAGALMTAGQPPVSVPWTLFLAVPMLVWLLDRAAGARAAFATGWAAAFGYFTTGLYWIGHAFLVDAERFAWMMPFAVMLLPAFLGLFWGSAFALARWRWPGSAWRVAVLAGWLTLAEYARSTVVTGFPWALPGYVWVETPIAQAAAWVGPFGLSLLTLLLCGLPAVALRSTGVMRLSGLAALAAFAAVWFAGQARLDTMPPLAKDAPVVRLVQPNAVQKLKWDPDWTPVFFNRLIAGAAAPAGPAGPPDLIVWPETAVPFLPAEQAEARARITQAAGAPVVLGALDRGRGERLTNSLMVLADGEIVAQYDKHHLVPFGEYLPYPWFFGTLGFERLVPGRGFEAGPGPQVIEAAGLPAFSPLICYEMIFPGQVVPQGERPAFLLQVTNDAWFGRFGGPEQHLAQARMRAIEQGLPVIRAANTGISAGIDARGRIVARLALDTHGHVDLRLPPALPPSPYAWAGDWPALLLAMLSATCGFIFTRHCHS